MASAVLSAHVADLDSERQSFDVHEQPIKSEAGSVQVVHDKEETHKRLKCVRLFGRLWMDGEPPQQTHASNCHVLQNSLLWFHNR